MSQDLIAPALSGLARWPIACALALLVATYAPTQAGWRNYPRDPEVPKQFQRTHPCPSTGRTYGRCPGYVRDHVVPLCAGGADSPSNMQLAIPRRSGSEGPAGVGAVPQPAKTPSVGAGLRQPRPRSPRWLPVAPMASLDPKGSDAYEKVFVSYARPPVLSPSNARSSAADTSARSLRMRW